MEEKKYKASKGSNNEFEVTYTQVSEMLLSAGFMTMFKRMKIGEKMFNHDIMTEFERTK